MMAMDLAMDGDGKVLAAWGLAGAEEDEACHDEAGRMVVFQMTRGGLLGTAAGPVRIAVSLRVERLVGGRLVVAMLVAALTERSRWTLRRFSVPVDADCPREAVRVLGTLLPDILTDIPDGAMLMSDEDGVVLAEVLSRSGQLPRAGAVEIDLRGAANRSARGPEANFGSRKGGATLRQHA